MQGRSQPNNVFAVDFDGVLCNSAAETAVTAWRAGSCIWTAWQGLEPPALYLSRFLKLRPVVETGYESILLMRLIDTGVDDEAVELRFSELCVTLLKEIQHPKTDLISLFDQTRTSWINRDLDGWLNRHSFYPEIAEIFAARAERDPVFILTTKQECFVSLLLKSCGIRIFDDHIFGLSRGKSKEDVLDDLSRRPQFAGARFHFVEDKLQTLIRVTTRASLNHVFLYLADWGYNTPQEREKARSIPRITIWDRGSFMNV